MVIFVNDYLGFQIGGPKSGPKEGRPRGGPAGGFVVCSPRQGYVAASASRTHAVLLREDGHAVSWGYGRAGPKQQTPEETPEQIHKSTAQLGAPMITGFQGNVMSLNFLMGCAMSILLQVGVFVTNELSKI